MSFGTIPLSLDDKPDGFVLLSMYEKLESENAKLRDELDAAKHDLSLFSERIVELGAENAKLRELCKAWSKFAYELFDEFIGEPEMDDDFMELDDRMRELGVDA